MVTHRRFALAFVLGCLLLCSFGPHSASGSADGEIDGSTESSFAGGRHLLQTANVCPHQWQYDNFTVLEENCPYVTINTTSYDKTKCCEYGLGSMLCPYLALVNDPSSNCAASFFSTLRLVAPNYTDNFFQSFCSDPTSPGGIQCPSNLTGSTTNQTSSVKFSARSHSFGLTLLLAVAIFEIVVLLF